MVPTLKSDEPSVVLAPVGGGRYARGARHNILIIAPSQDADVPLPIRRALVGLIIPTIFDSEQAEGVVPRGCRIAYAEDVAEALQEAGEEGLARALLTMLKIRGLEYYGVVFTPESYRLLDSVNPSSLM